MQRGFDFGGAGGGGGRDGHFEVGPDRVHRFEVQPREAVVAADAEQFEAHARGVADEFGSGELPGGRARIAMGRRPVAFDPGREPRRAQWNFATQWPCQHGTQSSRW